MVLIKEPALWHMANKKKEILLRAYLGFVAILVLGIAILGRAFYIQTVKGDYYRAMGDSLTIEEREVLADRGNIYSIDGRLMATTLPTFDIRMDFKTTYSHSELWNAKVDSVAMLLAGLFKDKTKDQYKKELLRERRNKSRYYLLKRNVRFNELAEMKTWPLFREGQYKSGMVIVQNDKRLMPFDMLAKRTIGFINEGGARVGLEGNFDTILRGEKGIVKVQRIAGGGAIPLDSKDQLVPKPGRDVYTTLDIELQDVAEDALQRALKHHQADHGCVVLMEAKTGRIKAIANLGMNKDSTYGENFNYAVGEATEPGSTFKLATAAALMEDGLVNNNTMVEVGNGIAKFYNLTIKDHEAPEATQITLKRAIEVSSNVAMARLAFDNYASNPEKFYKHLKDFGFTQKVGIELQGAAKPVLRDPKKWDGTSSAFIAYGYEIQISALHTLMFYNAIANGGAMVQPHIVEKVKEYDRTVDSTVTNVLNERLLSEHTVKQLQEILVGVVEEGTATNLKTDYLHIAGKTGTAVIAQGNQGYKKRIYQASFCGYFPAEAPEYTMIVVINSPGTNGYYGNVVAGSIFREVADKVYSLSLDMHNSVNGGIAHNAIPAIVKGHVEDIKKIYEFFGQHVNSDGGEWASVDVTANSILLAENEPVNNVVPDVTGMSLKDAIYMLETLGMHVSVKGMGRVHTQSVVAGTQLQRGMTITIELN
ncbi:MAG: penicillin-binding protein [Chitinophagales bacterium]